MYKPQNILSERIEKLTNDLQIMTTCRDHWKNSYEERNADNAALREANDLQRDSIQRLSAQVAGLRESLQEWSDYLESTKSFTGDNFKPMRRRMKQALSSPDPGAEIRERMAKLEAVLNDIYPAIAGRVIQLQKAGEEKAAAEWNEIAKQVFAALEEVSEP